MSHTPHDGLLKQFAQTFGLYYQQLAVLFNVHRAEVVRMVQGSKSLPSHIMRSSVEAILAMEEDGAQADWKLHLYHAHRLLANDLLDDLNIQHRRALRKRDALLFDIEQQAQHYAYDLRLLSTVLLMQSLPNLPEPMREQLGHLRRKLQHQSKVSRFNIYCSKVKKLHYLDAEIKAIEELLNYTP
jgi:hypothetical protein